MDVTTDRIRVLHVDDDPSFGELTARLLEREDDRLDVTSVASVDAALDAFETGPVDCVVSDYDMPGTDGLAFLGAIRDRDEEVPFVLFTGEGNERVAGEAISAGVTDYLQKTTGIDQYAVLAHRITNAVAAYRARLRAARQEHINTLIREINRRLVDAVSVAGIERAVCETIAESEPYRFAWVGEPDPESGEVVPRAAAGDGERYLEEVTIRHDDRPRGWGPAGMAVRTRETQLVRNIPEDPSFEPWHDAAAAYGYESVVVLPLFRGDLLHGVLSIYADHPDAFADVERNVLAELAQTIGRALEAAHVRRRLRTRERALERQNERLEALAGVVSHDLRNHLNVASGRLETVREDCESEHLGAVARAHDRMETLVEDLLALAREGRASTDVEPVDLSDAMATAWRNVETPGARLIVETDRVVRADGTRLQQLLENLVCNAVERGARRTSTRDARGDAVEHGSTSPRSGARGDVPSGPVAGEEPVETAVTVRLGDLEDGFYVENDGPGSPPDRREAVLEPGHSTSDDGTGFGLNTVRRIAETHDWTLSVTEGAEGGARYEFTGVEFER